ncbi:MAG: glycosyltransferase family 4 protein [Chlamydiales bacterium]|nr:glycosyltransferase family 4 protein [Chlamydiales bacterium]
MVTILHTEASPGWGGQEIRILRESLGLKERGYRVILAVNPKSPLAERAEEKGLTVYRVPFSYKKLFHCVGLLKKIIKNESVSVINTHSSVDAWICGFLAKFMKLPVVRTRHLSTRVKSGLNSLLLYNYLADAVVTTCQQVVPMLRRQAKLDESRCLSVPTGIDLSTVTISQEQQQDFRQKWGIEPGDIVIGTCCIMRQWKGVEYLLRAAKRLENKPKIKWLIVGGGVSLPHFEKVHKELGLGKQVIFTNHLENPLEAISCMDIFSLLSTGHEGVSQASLQAAYLGKPLITTMTGGLKEVCIEGVTGTIVPCFDDVAVAHAALDMLSDPKRLESMGRNAKKLVEEKFTFKKTIDDMESVCRKVLKNKESSNSLQAT